MRKTTYIWIVAAISLALICAVAGCSALDNSTAFARIETVRQVAQGTNLVPMTISELAPSPALQSTLAVASALPIPLAATGSLAIGLLASIYSAMRNKRALVAVVKGVEAAREWLQTTPEGKATDEKIKAQLILHQDAYDVLKIVGKVVNEQTGRTVRA